MQKTIILAAIDSALIRAWRTFFSEETNVVITEGDITQLKCDAIVSPANLKIQFKNFAEAQKYHWNINPQGMIWTH